MHQGMTTRRRAALSRPTLMHLPDEILSIIIMESIWASTLPNNPSRLPDLVSYHHRPTNHPSLQPGKIVFLGAICGRLRGMWKELLSTVPSSLGSTRSPAAKSWPYPFGLLPETLAGSDLKFLDIANNELHYLALLQPAIREQLVELELRPAGGFMNNLRSSSWTDNHLDECRSLQTVTINGRHIEAGALLPLLRVLGDATALRHLTLSSFLGGATAVSPDTHLIHFKATQLVRLEISHCYSLTLSHFVIMMGCVAPTIRVAIFSHYSSAEAMVSTTVGHISNMPVLWRLDIAFYGGKSSPSDVIADSTVTGRIMLATVSPVDIIKKAPALEYFDCSERVTVKTQEKLDEVAKLVDNLNLFHPPVLEGRVEEVEVEAGHLGGG